MPAPNPRYKDLTGMVFERLTVERREENGKWRCKCICGNVKEVYKENLVKGYTRSCGCLGNEVRVRNLAKRRPPRPRTKWCLDQLWPSRRVSAQRWYSASRRVRA